MTLPRYLLVGDHDLDKGKSISHDQFQVHVTSSLVDQKYAPNSHRCCMNSLLFFRKPDLP